MLFTASVEQVDQGEKIVGAATVQLIAASSRCHGVLIAASSASNTSGVNTSNILVGFNPAGNASGGFTLEPTNVAGVLIPISDPSLLYLTGFTEGDSVQYQILR